MKKVFFVCLLACSLALISTMVIVGCNDDDGSPGGYIDTAFQNYGAQDYINWLPREMPDARIAYLNNFSLAYGDLRIPKTNRLRTTAGYPVMVVLHGGGWSQLITLDCIAPFAEALTDFGIATWNIEFRRLGNPEGGYPGTLQDVGAAIDYLRVLAPEYNLDLSRVIVLGHSSGGHLALWAAGRHTIPSTSPLYVANPLPIKGVVDFGGIANMETAYAGGRADMWTFLGVTTTVEADLLYPTVSPYHMLPIGVPTSHFVGSLDAQWRIDGIHQYADEAIALGTEAHVYDTPGANEFDLIDPCGPAWPTIVTEVHWILEAPQPTGNLNRSKFCPVNGR